MSFFVLTSFRIGSGTGMIFKVGSESRVCLDDESAGADEISQITGFFCGAISREKACI
jgi:hypothetical protein